MEMKVNPIGFFDISDSGYRIVLDKAYRPALEGLDGFSHLNVLWGFSHCDDPVSRATLQEASPYKNSPQILGTFATRSPLRPNPIALSCVTVIAIDRDTGIIEIPYTDAENGSPILDIKPYTPSLDRVESPQTPEWCAHWPKSIDASGDFDWSAEFNF